MLLMSANIETLTAAEAFSISAVGFGIVFFVLIVLMAVISLLRAVVGRAGEAAESAPSPAIAISAPEAAAALPAKAVPAEVMLNGVDYKTAAMIMAIVADKMNAPLHQLRFISIAETGGGKGNGSV